MAAFAGVARVRPKRFHGPMQIAGVSVWNGLAARLTPQRLAAVVLVILLHIIGLFMLLEAGVIRVPPVVPFKETTIWIRPEAPKKKPPRQAIQPARKPARSA